MQSSWTKGGWELLEGLALNAALYTMNVESGRKVLRDAIKLTNQVTKFPESGESFENVYGELRYKSVFHSGKVAVWKIENKAPIFLGAWYSLPDLFLI